MLTASVNGCAIHLRFAVSICSSPEMQSVTGMLTMLTDDLGLQRCISHHATAL